MPFHNLDLNLHFQTLWFMNAKINLIVDFIVSFDYLICWLQPTYFSCFLLSKIKTIGRKLIVDEQLRGVKEMRKQYKHRNTCMVANKEAGVEREKLAVIYTINIWPKIMIIIFLEIYTCLRVCVCKSHHWFSRWQQHLLFCSPGHIVSSNNYSGKVPEICSLLGG